MSTGSIFMWLGIVALFIIANGLFVAAEFAVIRLRKSRVQEMVKSGAYGAPMLAALQKDIENSIAGAQLGITLASLVVGAMGEKAVSAALEMALNAIPGFEHAHVPHLVGLVLTFTLLSGAHIIIGEQVPKFIGIRFPEKTLLRLGLPFRLFCRLTSPFLSVMNFLSNLAIRVMGFENEKEEQRHPSAREFQIMVEESAKAGTLGKQESDLLVSALELRALTVRDVMRPKTQVQYLRNDFTLAQVMRVVVETKHGKLPVFDSLDNKVVGILGTKDLFDVWFSRFAASGGGAKAVPTALQESFNLSHLLRQAHFVPDTMKASTLLEDMRAKRLSMVMVADEFGNTIGIVCLEDLLEQLVGDIWDEYDKPQRDIVKTGENTWKVAGGVTLFEFSKVSTRVLEFDGYNITLAGTFVEKFGRTPKIGDSISLSGYTLTVLDKEGQTITSLEVKVQASIS
ncbi:HlyC/CorC family transporter [Candidatus Obscuribacterales bacterium]|nr:HlyC/CorC family transporter [Candidatus Obscuribacterales bacterium]